MPVFLSPRVREARDRGQPLVGLETALLTHGLPWPTNLEVFREMEAAVADEGGAAAAVAVVSGVMRVGLDAAEIEVLAREPGARKAGVADLPALVAAAADAGTTVAATLWACGAAGIRVFATGGIGGVHRGAESTFDVSGDLAALSRFGGCVICSGAKVVLDLPKTLQALEALGVCVIGYGSDRFPAFVCDDSGLPVAHRVDDPAAVARVVRARDSIGLSQAVLVANPPPVERALPRATLERDLAGALTRAERQGIRGPGVTPFLLAELASASGGATLEANRALLVANARLAARVAHELQAGAAS